MHAMRSPQRRRLAAGSVATALALGGAVALTTTSASAAGLGPGGGPCNQISQFTITMPVGATEYMPTSLISRKGRVGKTVTLPLNSQWSVQATMPQVMRSDAAAILWQANARFRLDVAYGWSGRTKTTSTQVVKANGGQRMQLQKLARRFTVRKYAVNKSTPCVHGRLLYKTTVLAPVASNNVKYFHFALVR